MGLTGTENGRYANRAYRRYEYRTAPKGANASEAELAALEGELGWHLLIRATFS